MPGHGNLLRTVDTGTQVQTIYHRMRSKLCCRMLQSTHRMLRVTLYCCRPSRAPAIAGKELTPPARQPSRGGSSKQRGSQTARENSSRSLLGTRREMYESKTAAEVSMLIAIAIDEALDPICEGRCKHGADKRAAATCKCSSCSLADMHKPPGERALAKRAAEKSMNCLLEIPQSSSG